MKLWAVPVASPMSGGTGGGAPSATYDAFMRMETGRVSDMVLNCAPGGLGLCTAFP